MHVPHRAEASGLVGFEARSWFGLQAPAGTPPAVVSRSQQAVAKALNVPAIKRRLTAQGAMTASNASQAFTGLMAAGTAQ
ncbi:tripartite tricarboxylate transporter substrate-binding protein [Hydrogenophaga sp.]|uniref:tripartite tricarboxylate transporter substrate-binding protein n=1 Tax=Hydrogenophaga sp. TaxID=1904254 RepID=UPI003F6DA02C